MKSYFKFLSRNKLYTSIEALGLAMSLAFVIVIGTYVWQQYKVVYEHPDHDRIYMLGTDEAVGLGNFDKEDVISKIPEIEMSAYYQATPFPEKVNLGREFRTIRNQIFVDQDFFRFFPHYAVFPAGSLEDFNSLDKIFISESLAESFSDDDLLGKSLTTVYGDYIIAGIVADRNNKYIPDADVYYNFALTQNPDYRGMFTSAYTFFKAREGVSREEIESKVIPLCQANYLKEYIGGASVRLYSLKESYFHGDIYHTAHADKYQLMIFLAAALALLVSAIINYINLSFALSCKRAKEMATRKLLGARESDVLLKCLAESVAFTVICFGAALMLAVALEPLMNRLLMSERSWSFILLDINLTVGYLLVTLGFAVLVGILAGLIPALHASHYEPIEVVSGLYRRKSKMVFSKVFIIVQNVLSVVLISSAVLMEAQLAFMMDRPMNSNCENLFCFRTVDTYQVENKSPLADAFRSLPEVVGAGLSSGYQGKISMGFSFTEELESQIQCLYCDSSFFHMLEPQIIADFAAPLKGSVWLSESAAASMDLSDGIPEKLADELRLYDPDFVFHPGGIYMDIPACNPLYEFYNDRSCIIVRDFSNEVHNGPCDHIILQTVSEEPEVRAAILEGFEKFNEESGTYSVIEEADFISDAVYASFEPTRRQVRLIEMFMFVAVILSLMGLIAMSTYYSEQKSKEIAVRKVFGGTVGTETAANVRSYMTMVMIASIIGVPIAVYAAGRYLEQFSYRIGNYWWIFVVAVVISFVMSLLSVLWQTLKAARTNPAAELKKE